jgi:hypothetical protein
MKKISLMIFTIIIIYISTISCNSINNEMTRIIFLHHSTGQVIWNGGTNKYIRKLTNRSDVKTFLNKYNRKNKTNYSISERVFPNGNTYGWSNNPYDYYNIWVKNAGEKPYMNEPTLEILTKEFDIIIFKHCYPTSRILEDTGIPDIDTDEKRIENYKLQYDALKNKMHEFPDTKFIVWTPAVEVINNITPEQAQRTNDFYKWVINEWDERGDNIFIWDFYSHETEGGLYFKDEYSISSIDSHPNKQFAGRVAPLFAQYIIDVAEGKIK